MGIFHSLSASLTLGFQYCTSKFQMGQAFGCIRAIWWKSWPFHISSSIIPNKKRALAVIGTLNSSRGWFTEISPWFTIVRHGSTIHTSWFLPTVASTQAVCKSKPFEVQDCLFLSQSIPKYCGFSTKKKRTPNDRGPPVQGSTNWPEGKQIHVNQIDHIRSLVPVR